MLEHPGVRLVPSKSDDDAPSSFRIAILSLGGTEELGAAWWSAGSHGWLSWLHAGVLEVHESDDEPLLMLLQRRWGIRPRCQVKDADARIVGQIVGANVCDRNNRRLAKLVWESGKRSGRFETTQGRTLAHVVHEGRATRLTFSNGQSFNPFRRMLLLGATLRILIDSA